MKTLTSLILFLFLQAPAALATTVLITITGRVSATDAAVFFPLPPVEVGDVWTVTLSYPHPSPPVAFDLGGFHYGGLGLNHRLTFTVNGLLWLGEYALRASAGAPFEDIDIASSMTAPAQITPGAGSSIVLRLQGGDDLAGNPASLPDSFSDWNLPGATSFSLENINLLDSQANAWRIRANSFDTMTIQVIPEPSAVGLAGLVAIAGLGRRRRVRA